jgi:hypothetical protein
MNSVEEVDVLQADTSIDHQNLFGDEDVPKRGNQSLSRPDTAGGNLGWHQSHGAACSFF